MIPLQRMWTLLRKFLSLPGERKLQLLHCWLLLWGVRGALLVLPSQALLAWAKRSLRPDRISSPEERRTEGRKLAAMVAQCSRAVPGARCLARALTLQVLLGHRGHPCDLHIGVARSPREGFTSHAWIVLDGEVVLGGTGAPLAYRSILVSASRRTQASIQGS